MLHHYEKAFRMPKSCWIYSGQKFDDCPHARAHSRDLSDVHPAKKRRCQDRRTGRVGTGAGEEMNLVMLSSMSCNQPDSEIIVHKPARRLLRHIARNAIASRRLHAFDYDGRHDRGLRPIDWREANDAASGVWSFPMRRSRTSPPSGGTLEMIVSQGGIVGWTAETARCAWRVSYARPQGGFRKLQRVVAVTAATRGRLQIRRWRRPRAMAVRRRGPPAAVAAASTPPPIKKSSARRARRRAPRPRRRQPGEVVFLGGAGGGAGFCGLSNGAAFTPWRPSIYYDDPSCSAPAGRGRCSTILSCSASIYD